MSGAVHDIGSLVGGPTGKETAHAEGDTSGGALDEIGTKRCNGSSYITRRALQAIASSSGVAACPGGTRSPSQGSTPGVRE